MSEPITVVIADDHPLFRSGLDAALAAVPNVQVVGRAEDGDAALAMIEKYRPRIAILDLQMPRRSGLQVAAEVRARKLDTRLVFLTMLDGADLLRKALDLGARGYVLKESAASDIKACVNLVAEGRTYISPGMSQHLVDAPAPPPAGLDRLTRSEKEVLRLIGQQYETKEIAKTLGISPKTVENHRSNICARLDIHGHNALLKFALQHQSSPTP